MTAPEPTQSLTDREWERLGELVAAGHFDNEYRAVKGLYEAVMYERAKAAELESQHQGALAAMWETVLSADIETAALRVQFEQVQTQLGSWDLDDEQIDQLASDSNPVRRAEQWLKLTSYRACGQSLKPILAVHRCPKCGHEVDAEETEDFIGHIRRHDDDSAALDQPGEGEANA
jgi:hypothetical protein